MERALDVEQAVERRCLQQGDHYYTVTTTAGDERCSTSISTATGSGPTKQCYIATHPLSQTRETVKRLIFVIKLSEGTVDVLLNVKHYVGLQLKGITTRHYINFFCCIYMKYTIICNI